MKFTRRVSWTDEFCGDVPDVMAVEIDADLAARIEMLAAEAKRLKVFAIQEVDYHAELVLRQSRRGRELAGRGGSKLEIYDLYGGTPGKEFTGRFRYQMLNVADDDFWWSANLKNTSVVIREPLNK